MENVVKERLLEKAAVLFGTEITNEQIQFQKTRKDVEGDLTLVLFPFVKILKTSPNEIGEKIGDFLVGELDFI
jgi:arginyl-tRNA synthetase